MKEFDIVFIANCHDDEEDSCDFKEWKTVTAINADAAIKKMSKFATVISCEETTNY